MTFLEFILNLGGTAVIVTDVKIIMQDALKTNAHSETRLDNTLALTDKRVVYKNTFVNYLKEEIDTTILVKELRPKLINMVKTTPEMKAFRDLEMTVIYSYRDKETKHVCNIPIKLKDYQDW